MEAKTRMAMESGDLKVQMIWMEVPSVHDLGLEMVTVGTAHFEGVYVVVEDSCLRSLFPNTVCS